MKTFSTQRLLRGMLPVAMLAVMGAAAGAALRAAHAGSTGVTVDGKGSGAMSTEARQSKSSGMIPKPCARVNTRVEKEFDKADRAADDEDRCNDSNNVNAYWGAGHP